MSLNPRFGTITVVAKEDNSFICSYWGNKGKINEALQIFQLLNAV